jgi:hypothetical protein
MQVTATLDQSSLKWITFINNKRIASTSKWYVADRARQMGAEVTFSGDVNESAKVAAEKISESEFTINQRFGFVERLVKMVADGVQPSAVITGQGGLGKSHTVLNTLKNSGYHNAADVDDSAMSFLWRKSKMYTIIKGYSTAKGLYRTLYENNNSVIIFDDCDSVMKDPVALNLLKGALDSYGKRTISWNAEMRDDDLPRMFDFTGRVIFISNMSQNQIDQAIRTRSMMIDLTMTVEQKIERMGFIASSDDFMPEYSADVKKDALAFIKQNQNRVKELSLRTLITVCKIRASNTDWQPLATYILTA